MDPDELMQLLDTLSPRDRDDVMKELGISESDLFNAQGAGMVSQMDYGGDSPEFDDAAMEVMGYGTADYPQFTAKGEIDPFDLSQIISRMGLVNNQASRIADYSTLAMMGSDPGMYDVNAFNPTVTGPTERLRSPGRENLSRLVSGGTPYERYIAELMTTRGMSGAAAVQQMMRDINEPDDPSLSAADRQAKQDLIDSLSSFSLESKAAASGFPYAPGGADKDKNTIEYDIPGLVSLASDWDKMLQEDPLEGEGWVDELGEFGPPGTRYTEQPLVEDSDAAEWYKSRGLPLPTEQYTDPKYMDALVAAAAPTYGQELYEREQGVGTATRARDQAFQKNRNAGMDLSELERAMASGVLDEPEGAKLPWPSLIPLTGETGLEAGPPGGVTSPGFGRVTASPGLNAVAFNELSPEAQLERLNRTGGQGIIDRAGTRAPRSGGAGTGASVAREQPPHVPMFKGNQQVAGVIGAPGFNFGQFAGMPGELRQMKESDIAAARKRRGQTSRDAVRAQGDWYASTQRATPGILAAQRTMGETEAAARFGRTPSRDAVMQRLLGLRMLTGT